MNLELKPCPFCGGTAEVITTGWRGDEGCKVYDWRTRCTECHIGTESFSDRAFRSAEGISLKKDGRKNAIEAWNNRVEDRKQGVDNYE